MADDTDTEDAPAKLRLGGMALANGLLVHGPTRWAVAVRGGDGAVRTASGTKPKVTALDDVPGLRGLARLAEAMAVIPLAVRALPEVRLPFGSPRVLAAALATTAAGAVLKRRGATGEAAALGLSLLPSLVALRGGELAAYHGAEHKTIGAYEDGTDDHTKEHDRCGSHLMAPLLASNLAGAALLRRAVDRPGPLAGAAVTLTSLGIAVETFAWSERHAQTRTARLLRRPGHELQRVLGTREPTDAQLEVGRAALAAVLEAEGSDGDAHP